MSLRRLAQGLVLLAIVAVVAVPVALAFGFDDSSHPPDGTVGTAYSYKFVGRNGCPPYAFVVKSGAPPPGLSLDSGGTLSGTPTTPGSFVFWVEVRDTGCGPSATCPPAGVSCSAPSQRPFTVNIAEKLTVATGALSPATVNVPYSVKLAATGGGSQAWSVASGALPAGLTLAPDGTLAGTPTAATSAPVAFVVKVTDGARTDTKSLSLDVVAPLAATPATIATTEVGHALKPTTLVATGGRSPYTWTIAGAPTWVTLDPAAAVLTGTPSTPGSFSAQVSVKDVYGTAVTLDLLVTVKAKLAVVSTRLPVTRVGKIYSATLRTNGGVAPLVWKVTSGKFPVGIRLDRTTGVLRGKPGTAGAFPLTIGVTDSLGATASVPLTLTVNALPRKHKKKHQ